MRSCSRSAGAGARVTVAARRLDAAESAAALVPGGQAVTLGDVDPGVYDLVVNATPARACRASRARSPVERLNPGQLVVDTVYHPMETPFLAAARARGIHAVNGLGMLVHQAALAFESWTGLDAPVAAMRAAAVETAPPIDRRRPMTAVLVAGCSILGLVVGWFLDPVITRVPLKVAGVRPARRRRAAAVDDAVACSSPSSPARCSAPPRPASTTRGCCPRTSCSPARSSRSR